MTVCIFNTLTRSKVPFLPLDPGRVKMYVCGPTVYDEPHLGHAKSAVVFDVIRRYLTARGYQVALVRNVTDIDDKILQKARQQDQDFRTLGARYLRKYEQAMRRLKVALPDAQPKATEFIVPIQDFISRLLQSGHAYAVGGNVYFAVAAFKPYGKLSGRTIQTVAMDDDFNFPMALAIIFEGIRRIQRAIGADADGLCAQQLKNHQMAICDLNFICREILGFGLETALYRGDLRGGDRGRGVLRR